MNESGSYKLDYTSKRAKQHLIGQAMRSIGGKQREYIANQTALEKLLVHFKLLQKEMEKDGLFPFERML